MSNFYIFYCNFFHDFIEHLHHLQQLFLSAPQVLYDQPTGRLALVFELMEANLYELIKGKNEVHQLITLFWKIESLESKLD